MATVDTAAPPVAVSGGRSHERNTASLIFVVLLWFSLFFGIAVLIALLIDTFITGSGRLDGNLVTQYNSTINEETAGIRAGILGTAFLMVVTALMAIPVGIGAAIYFEEFADKTTWYNRLLEVNIQNLAAVPSVIYGLLAVAAMSLWGFDRDDILFAGGLALALLILPVIIITTREAVRAVPREIRDGSLALGATMWQTTWRNTLPSAVPGIATGTIISLSRAIGEAAPLLMLGVPLGIYTDPQGLFDTFTALPLIIFQWTASSQDEYNTAAAAAIIVLLAMVLVLNALAIYIRNRFQRTW